MVAMIDNKWMTIQEVVQEIGCTPSYVRRLLRDEVLSGKKVGERAWVIDAKSVSDFSKKPKKTGRPRSQEKNN
jgi:predicted transcriptional regulator